MSVSDAEILKTSAEWYEVVCVPKGILIYDPDGWDRRNYDYSFSVEKITEKEFQNRLSISTISIVSFENSQNHTYCKEK